MFRVFGGLGLYKLRYFQYYSHMPEQALTLTGYLCGFRVGSGYFSGPLSSCSPIFKPIDTLSLKGPQTLNPTPETLTLNPKPYTLYPISPKPKHLKPKPWFAQVIAHAFGFDFLQLDGNNLSGLGASDSGSGLGVRGSGLGFRV